MSYIPIDIQKLTKTCYPQNLAPAKKLAGQIDSALSTASSLIGYTPEIRGLREKLYAHLEQHSQGGCGCTAPSDRQMCEGLLSSASAIRIPTITPQEEMDILNVTLPPVEIEPSFVRRNAKPVLIGGSVLVMGALGMILLLRS